MIIIVLNMPEEDKEASTRNWFLKTIDLGRNKAVLVAESTDITEELTAAAPEEAKVYRLGTSSAS